MDNKQRENGALLIAACIVAAIRLRGEEIKPSPRLTAIVKDSVTLARLVLAEIEHKGMPRRSMSAFSQIFLSTKY